MLKFTPDFGRHPWGPKVHGFQRVLLLPSTPPAGVSVRSSRLESTRGALRAGPSRFNWVSVTPGRGRRDSSGFTDGSSTRTSNRRDSAHRREATDWYHLEPQEQPDDQLPRSGRSSGGEVSTSSKHHGAGQQRPARASPSGAALSVVTRRSNRDLLIVGPTNPALPARPVQRPAAFVPRTTETPSGRPRGGKLGPPSSTRKGGFPWRGTAWAVLPRRFRLPKPGVSPAIPFRTPLGTRRPALRCSRARACRSALLGKYRHILWHDRHSTGGHHDVRARGVIDPGLRRCRWMSAAGRRNTHPRTSTAGSQSGVDWRAETD